VALENERVDGGGPGPRQTLFDARTVGDQTGCELPAFFVIGLDIGRDEIGVVRLALRPSKTAVEKRA